MKITKELLKLTAVAGLCLIASGCLFGDDSDTATINSSSSQAATISSSSVQSSSQVVVNQYDTVKTPVLSGVLTGKKLLLSSIQYEISGFVYVPDSSSLTIQPGTKIVAEGVSALIIQRGAKIYAEGTAQAPIVFTSKKQTPATGDWAGIVLHGKAPVSLAAGVTDKNNEALADKFGGTDPADNSGVLKYVRIEYAGYAVATDAELNGLTLGGVGSGTVIEYVQVYEGQDDAIEWFGGTVNGSYLVANKYHDDGFDIDEGYVGTNKYLLNIQGSESDEGIEAGNKAPNPELITAPIFENITIIANGTDGGAIQLKDNSALDLRKAVIITTDTTKYALQVLGTVAIAEVGFATKMTNVFVGGSPLKIVDCADATAKAALEATITVAASPLIDAQGVTVDAAAKLASAGAAPVSIWWGGWSVDVAF